MKHIVTFIEAGEFLWEIIVMRIRSGAIWGFALRRKKLA